jgi:hypothetical protein
VSQASGLGREIIRWALPKQVCPSKAECTQAGHGGSQRNGQAERDLRRGHASLLLCCEGDRK